MVARVGRWVWWALGAVVLALAGCSHYGRTGPARSRRWRALLAALLVASGAMSLGAPVAAAAGLAPTWTQ